MRRGEVSCRWGDGEVRWLAARTCSLATAFFSTPSTTHVAPRIWGREEDKMRGGEEEEAARGERKRSGIEEERSPHPHSSAPLLHRLLRVFHLGRV